MTTTLPVFTERWLDMTIREHVLLIWGVETRPELVEFLARQGFDISQSRPADGRPVVSVEYDVIDMPLLRIRYLALDPDGYAILDADGFDSVKCEVEQLLVGDLPSWWRPA